MAARASAPQRRLSQRCLELSELLSAALHAALRTSDVHAAGADKALSGILANLVFPYRRENSSLSSAALNRFVVSADGVQDIAPRHDRWSGNGRSAKYPVQDDLSMTLRVFMKLGACSCRQTRSACVFQPHQYSRMRVQEVRLLLDTPWQANVVMVHRRNKLAAGGGRCHCFSPMLIRDCARAE